MSKIRELVIAGGKIHCARCQAMSKRTKLQCSAPAERGKRVCRFHGARSTGPKTEASRLLVVRGKVKLGDETRQARAERSNKFAELAQIEDALHVLGLTDAPRTRGPKPRNYRPIKSMQDVIQFVVGQLARPCSAVSELQEEITRKTS